MRILKIILLGTGLAFGLFSCQSKPTIHGFQEEIWKKDKNGCKSIREPLMQVIEEQRDNFLELSQEQILALLGQPDINSLSKRGQRFYIYFYKKGAQCGGEADIENGKLLKLRFSAMGIVTELMIQ